MFNALRTDELLIGVGRVLRDVAGLETAPDEWERGQLLTALSVTRLLAAEQATAPELLAYTRDRVIVALDAHGESAHQVAAARTAMRDVRTGSELGEAIADLLLLLPRDAALRTALHEVLADMSNREVAGLAAAPR